MRPALLLLPLLVACQASSPPTTPTAAPGTRTATTAPTVMTDPATGTPPAVLPAPATATVVEAMENEATPLHVGQILRINLRGNGSTGYQWEVAPPLPPQLALETTDSLPQPPDGDDGPAIVGAPHEEWIYLRAVASGDAVVEVQWRRPWEKDQPPARVLRYAVSVR